MKTWYRPLAFATCFFIAGVACTAYVVESLKQDLWRDLMLTTASRDFEFDAQNQAALQLHNIDSAQRGDTGAIIRMNCLLLRSNLRGLQPKGFGPAREAEVAAFLERARATVASLDKQSLCSFSSNSAQQ
jgi:hypothetical protein